MKHRVTMYALALACVLAGSAIAVRAQDRKPDPAAQKAAMDDMMKKMMEAAAPGAPHRKLAELVGTWETSTAMTMYPGQPPAVTKGTAVYTMVLDGRFLVQEVKGEMMGMPMNGIGYTGYNNVDKKYTLFWIDNFGTVMSTAEGSADQSGRVISFYGKMDEPTTGEHDKNVKYVLRMIDKDKHILEIHDLAIGEPNTKVVEVTYTRKK